MQSNKQLIIAVDGHSSCGKSTFAKAIAKKLGYIYIDTGAMYRAVTLFAMRNNLIADGKVEISKLKVLLGSIHVAFVKNVDKGHDDMYLNGENVEEEIRRMEVSNNVSQISQIKEVREKMVDLQRKMGESRGVILDGRDIGTVVFPNADIKLFMTADPEVRAGRRFKELSEKGDSVSFEEILANVKKRDEIDTTRAESPLRKADDAIVLDNSFLTPEQQLKWFDELIENLPE
jgi:cytidylate kinase